MMNDKTIATASVITAGLASLCCIGPIVFAGLGATAVGLSAKFEPLRPYFLTLTGIFLALGFYFVYRKPKEQEACESEVCETPRLTRWAKPGLWLVTVVVILLALFPNYYGAFRTEGAFLPAADASSLATEELEIEGMTCEACAAGIESALRDLPGVAHAQVSFEQKKAQISYDPSEISTGKFIETVANTGYKASKIEPNISGPASAPSVAKSTVIMKIDGMTCEACAAGLEGALKQVSGVSSAVVSFKENQATVSYDTKSVTPDQLAQAVTESGFKVVD